MPTDPTKICCLAGKDPKAVAAHLEQMGFKCVKVGELQTDPATGKVYNKNSTIYRYDDPNSNTVHFVRIDDNGHMMDAQRGNVGGNPHYHIDTCDKSQPASPDRSGTVPTHPDGTPVNQADNYQKQYEPGAKTYDDDHNQVSKPGSGGPNEQPDMGTWAKKTHHLI